MSTAPKKSAQPEAVAAPSLGEKVVDKVATIAGQSLDKAQAAANKATEVAHGNLQLFDATAGALRSGVVELQLKTLEIAQANTDAAFTFLRELIAVRDPAAFAKLQSQFLSRQAGEFVRQASELGELAGKCARETAKPCQEGFTRSVAELTRGLAV